MRKGIKDSALVELEKRVDKIEKILKAQKIMVASAEPMDRVDAMHELAELAYPTSKGDKL